MIEVKKEESGGHEDDREKLRAFMGNPFCYQHAAFVILPEMAGSPAGIGSCPPEPTHVVTSPLTHSRQYGVASQGACLPGPGVSRYQNNGSQPAAGTRGPRRGGREAHRLAAPETK